MAECARYEVENQLMKNKIIVFEQEVAQMTEQLNEAVRGKSQLAEESVSLRAQVASITETSSSLTEQA